MTKVTVSILLYCCIIIHATTASNAPIISNPSFKLHLPGNPYDTSDDDTNQDGILGSGREFDLFDTREGLSKKESDVRFASSTSKRRSTGRYFPKAASRHSAAANQHNFIRQVQEFWSENLPHLPKLNVRLEPTTTLKIRKTFRPLKTIISIGADFNTQLGVWQFKTSWEDTIIGGKLTLAGKELQLTKSWQLKVGPVDDLVTRLRFRAAVDLQTAKAYCRVGFRQERLSPLNVMEGFALQKQFNLDGNKGNIKLELKGSVALPEPELEYSTESSRFLTGLGDIDINLEEANLVLDY